MDSKDELEEIDIKKRTYYYFADIIRILNIDFNNILLNFIKTFMGEKPLRIWFDKIDEFIKIDN